MSENITQQPEDQNGKAPAELAIAITAEEGAVRMQFGVVVSWMELSPEQAIQIADLLTAQAKKCREKALMRLVLASD